MSIRKQIRVIKFSNICNKSQHRQWIGLAILLALTSVLISGCSIEPNMISKISAIGEDTVPASQQIDNNILLSGTHIVVDGSIDGDLFAVGNTITINGPVSGSIFAFGQKIEINSEISGSLYSISQILKLNTKAHIINNAHYVGFLLDTLPGSIIERDLVALSIRGRLESEIGRSLNGFILLLTFGGRIGVPKETPSEPDNTPTQTSNGEVEQSGFKSTKNQRLLISSIDQNMTSFITRQPIYEQNVSAGEYSTPRSDLEEVLPAWIFDRLIELTILLPLGLFVLWLFPLAIKKPAERLRRKPLSTIGYGLLGVVIAINIFAIISFLFALLLMFGIWLGSAFSWNLSFIVWSVGLPALMLLSALFVLVILFGGKIILAYLAGSLIFEKIAPKAIGIRILPFVVGIILYIILRAIPTFGYIFEGIITVLGLGGIWMALLKEN
jgi:hypothetical protein